MQDIFHRKDSYSLSAFDELLQANTSSLKNTPSQTYKPKIPSLIVHVKRKLPNWYHNISYGNTASVFKQLKLIHGKTTANSYIISHSLLFCFEMMLQEKWNNLTQKLPSSIVVLLSYMSTTSSHNTLINIDQNTVKAQLFNTIQFQHNRKKGYTQLVLTKSHEHADHMQSFLSEKAQQWVIFNSTTRAVAECILNLFLQQLQVTVVQPSVQHEWF